MTKKASTPTKTPPKKTNSKYIKKQKAQWIGFINYSLQQQDKDYIMKMGFTPVKAFAAIETFVDAGYKVSFLPSSTDGNYGISVYGYWSDIPNAGYAMTVWHGSYIRCIEILVHLHSNVCNGESWHMLEDRDDFNW